MASRGVAEIPKMSELNKHKSYLLHHIRTSKYFENYKLTSWSVGVPGVAQVYSYNQRHSYFRRLPALGIKS